MAPELNVGAVTYNDGDSPRLPRGGFQGEALVSGMGPWYLEQLIRGNVFIYPTAAAGVLAKAADTTPTMMIWNPSDSGRLLVPVKVNIGAVSGTVILSHLAYGYQGSMGSAVGTAAPVVSQTKITPVNGLIGSGKVSRMNFGVTQTLTAAPTYLAPSGISAPGAFAAGAQFRMEDWLEGLLGVLPGSGFFPFLSNGAMALTAAVAVIGLELPLPSYAT